jgi:hypothetical protein
VVMATSGDRPATARAHHGRDRLVHARAPVDNFSSAERWDITAAARFGQRNGSGGHSISG